MGDIRCDISFNTVQKSHKKAGDEKKNSIEVLSFEYSIVVPPRSPYRAGEIVEDKGEIAVDVTLHVADAANAPSFLNAMYSSDFFGMGLYVHRNDAEDADVLFDLSCAYGQVLRVSHSASETDNSLGFAVDLRMYQGSITGRSIHHTGDPSKDKSEIFEFGKAKGSR